MDCVCPTQRGYSDAYIQSYLEDIAAAAEACAAADVLVLLSID